MSFIGRKEEINKLDEIFHSGRSAFVALYGRRRVGKTFLIRKTFENKLSFYCTGLANANLSAQLGVFDVALNRYGLSKVPRKTPSGWMEAFQNLIKLLEQQKCKRKIIFLDELPWMDTAQSGFIPALEHFWNSWASARKDIVLIVCGSAAGWMISNLINSKGGLHNRVTHRIRLQPFTLHECELFFKSRQAVYDRYQIMLLYMVMGGIPFYLEQVQISESAAQNINRLCFQQDGMLRDEFDNLYRSLFNKAEKHIAVIQLLSKKTKGLTRQEIIDGAKFSTGGGLTRILDELGECGFIRKYAPYGGTEKHSLFQLTDCYSLFYLKWIKNSSSLDDNTWMNQIDSPGQRAWAGYAFEQACLTHVRQIKKALGISGIQTTTSSWISTLSNKGAQIDLIIDRRDQVVNICEMKFSVNEFSIDKKYAGELRNKLDAFRIETKSKKALFLTFITSFGLKKNTYSLMVQNELTMDILFEP